MVVTVATVRWNVESALRLNTFACWACCLVGCRDVCVVKKDDLSCREGAGEGCVLTGVLGLLPGWLQGCVCGEEG